MSGGKQVSTSVAKYQQHIKQISIMARLKFISKIKKNSGLKLLIKTSAEKMKINKEKGLITNKNK